MGRSWLKLMLGMLCVGLVALVVAGCGDDDDDGGGGGGGGGGSATEAAKKEVTDITVTLPFQDSIVWSGYEISRGSDGDMEVVAGLKPETQAVEGNSQTIQQLISGKVDWAVTGASNVDGSIGYKQRRHEIVSQRDFVGWTGSVAWNWVPTGRTRMRLYLGRDIGGVDDLVTTYARTYTVSLNPSYQLTSKMSLNGTVQHQDLRFFGNTGFVDTTTTSGTLADRHDRINIVGLGLGYGVTRVFSMGLNYTWSHRNSNVTLGNYDDNVISLNGSLTF